MTPVRSPPMTTSSRNSGLSAMLAKGATKTASRNSMIYASHAKPLSPCGRGRGPLHSNGRVRGLCPIDESLLTPALSRKGRGRRTRSPMRDPEIGVDDGLIAAHRVGRAVGDLAAVIEDDYA